MSWQSGRRLLILGGIRSGKSGFAERLAAEQPAPGSAVRYVATAAPRDNDPEWETRIAAHRERRPSTWSTEELGADPARLLSLLAEAKPDDALLVDDLGGWLTATLDAAGAWGDDRAPEAAGADAEVGGADDSGDSDGFVSDDRRGDDLDDAADGPGAVRTPAGSLAAAVRDCQAALLVLVSPEVGLSVVPATTAGRTFADGIGAVNQAVAEACDAVVLVVAGQPTWLKGADPRGPVAVPAVAGTTSSFATASLATASLATAPTPSTGPAAAPTAGPVLTPTVGPLLRPVADPLAAAPAATPATPAEPATPATTAEPATAPGTTATPATAPGTTATPATAPGTTATPATTAAPATDAPTEPGTDTAPATDSTAWANADTAALPIVGGPATAPGTDTTPGDGGQPPIAVGMDLPMPDEDASAAAGERLATLDFAGSGLGALAPLIRFAAGTQGQPVPRPWQSVRMFLLHADHDGDVSAGDPPAASARRLTAVERGEGAWALLAGAAGVGVQTVRCPGSGAAIEYADALRESDVEAALRYGWELANGAVDAGTDLIVLGASGAGADAAAVAVIVTATSGEAAALLGQVSAPGGRIDDNAWMRRCAAIRDALHRVRSRARDPLAVLGMLGGADHAVATGIVLGAVSRRTPVLLDGPVGVASALVARDYGAQTRHWLLLPDAGGHPAVRLGAEVLGVTPVLDLNLGLGEGATALAALPLLRSAIALQTTP